MSSWGKFPLRSACCLPQCAFTRDRRPGAEAGDGRQVRLRDVSRIMADARYRKSPAELHMFRTASWIATEAMRAMLGIVAPGTRELEVAAAGDAVCKKLGAYGYGFDTMVCSGPRIDTIIGRSTNRVVSAGRSGHLGVSHASKDTLPPWGGRLSPVAPRPNKRIPRPWHPCARACHHPVAGRQTSSRVDLARAAISTVWVRTISYIRRRPWHRVHRMSGREDGNTKQ